MYKKIFILILVIVMVTAFVGCTKEEEKIVIASKPMTEQYILAEILTQLIEAKTDILVEQKMGIGGGTSNIQPAMEKGDIDIYPEYTGTGWMFVLKKDLINDSTKLYEEVKKEYKDKYNIEWSGLYGFNDTYGMAVKEEIAKKFDIDNYTDLAKVSDQLKIGAEYDFYEREDGYPGLSSVYNFNFKNKTELDIGLKYQAISNDQVDVINVFSTDGRLKQENLKVLNDDKNFFPSYYAATLVRGEVLDKYPELKDVIELLTGQISNDEMIDMNYQVEIEKKDPKEVAKEFLIKKGLL
jgi:glycine betaine/choline ABC-type transport system substrate-binding protein